MRKLRIVQQYVAAKNGGGLETEFRALCGRETLTSEFDLIPVVLENVFAPPPERCTPLCDIRIIRCSA